MTLLVAAMLHLHVWYAIAFQFDSHLGDSPPFLLGLGYGLGLALRLVSGLG